MKSLFDVDALMRQHQGCRVRVYRNLVKGCLSVQAKVDKRWKVVGYCQSAILQNSDVVISKAGQARARTEHTRNVHLYLDGLLQHAGDFPVAIPKMHSAYSYNPFYNDTLTCTYNNKNITTPITVCIVQTGRVFVV